MKIFLLNIAFICMFSFSLFGNPVRAALDIGSGRIKLAVAEVEESTGMPSRILFSDSTQCLLGNSFKQSQNGQLSPFILTQAEEVIDSYCAIADSLGAEEKVGIATAVFREAENGMNFIEMMNRKKGFDLQVVSQEKEGELGFLTAVASSGHDQDTVIAWDSGSVSFQISMKDENDFIVYKGPWGTAKILATLIRDIQGREFSYTSSSNPTTIEDLITLSTVIRDGLSPCSSKFLEKLSDNGINVVSIGGEKTSIFGVASEMIGSLQWKKEEVWRAIEEYVGRTDEEIAPLDVHALPKLAFLYTVMDHFNMHRVHYEPTNGSTLGIFLSSDLWLSCREKTVDLETTDCA